ncbi:MAG: TIGR02206 family membrane protein, partial [Solirubrobacteraceae bacterium]
MRQFSDQHIAALAVMVVAAAACIRVARRRPGRCVTLVSGGVALAIFAGWVGEYVADVVLGTWTVRYDLPLQLTDAISATSIVALLTRRQQLVELTYFWAFTATLQAVLTPDLAQSFPSVFYFTYFTY